MQTHIRFYLPGHYQKLLVNMPALNKWNSTEYLLSKMGDEFIYGSHYYNPKPFKMYAHSNTFANQKGEFRPFGSFMIEYEKKFNDTKLADKRSVNNVIWG
jgi:hypothetical protein